MLPIAHSVVDCALEPITLSRTFESDFIRPAAVGLEKDILSALYSMSRGMCCSVNVGARDEVDAGV